MSENEIEIIRAMDLPEYEGNPKDAKMLVTTSEGVKQMSGEAYPQLDTTTAAEGDIPAVGEGGNLVGSGIKAENVAQKSGYYAQMTAGAAENLVGQTPDKEAYLMRPTGGEGNEVANGIASVVGAEGNSCVWNQLVQNGDFSNGTTGWVGRNGTSASLNIEADGSCSTIVDSNGSAAIRHDINIIANHKYYIKYIAKGSSDFYAIFNYGDGSQPVTTSFKEYKNIYSQDTSATIALNMFVYERTALIGEKLYIKSCEVIDLTLLGMGNLTTTAQVEAWLAQHVGTKPYYAYNAGEILSAKMIGMRTVGRNLLNPETRQATLIPYTWEDNSNVFIVKNVPSGATATFTPDNTGEAVSVDVSGGSIDITNYGSGVLELSAATAETYVCFKWDGTKDNDVVPHVEHSYGFDVRKVYGKVNGAGEYVQCFPDDMKSAGSVHDTLTASEAVSKIERFVFGNNPITVYANYAVYQKPSSMKATIGNNFLLTNGLKKTGSGIASSVQSFSEYESGLNINIDGDGSHVASAMNGQVMYFERKTPITYTDLIYRDGGIDTPLSEVLIGMEVDNWGTEQQLVTPYEDGNPTSIPATLSTIYSMDAVEAIDTLQKTTYTETEVHDNLAAMLACVNTNCSEVLGGTFAVSDTATDKVFDFTFTPNAEPTENSNE